MNTIVILLFFLILFYAYTLYINPTNEDFMVYWWGGPVANIPNVVGYSNFTNFPFWNTRVGQTSNMSYDLRGDPLTIPKYPTMFNYSTLTPIYNKQLC